MSFVNSRATLGLAALALAMAVAQRAPAQESDWTFTLSPYLWAAGLDGDVRIGRAPPVSVDLSFGDILKDLNGAAMLSAEARRGRFLLEGDLMFVRTVSKDTLPGGIFSGFRFENDLFVMTALGGYRLLDTERNSIDLYAGLRRWSLDGDLRLTGGAAPTLFASRDKSWIDPIVGARAIFSLTERWSLALRASGGGFGVGADSEWGAFGAVTWRKSDRLSFTGGYRHLAVDYEDARLRYDVSLSGPILGLTWRF